MKQILYRHVNIPPFVTVWFRLIHELVGRHLLDLCVGRRLSPRRRYLLGAVGVVFSLVVQGIMLFMLAQLVDLCIDLMEVWTELASYHFALTSVRPS